MPGFTTRLGLNGPPCTGSARLVNGYLSVEISLGFCHGEDAQVTVATGSPEFLAERETVFRQAREWLSMWGTEPSP
ncbi:MAG TPA: hypothetical protein VKV02_00395 [Acidobacteriaceae bacterium]|nr:hypothetical protein [Acidobacteriaceae bacterium]